MYAPNLKLVATGYAGGNGGKNPEGINNPEMQFTHDIGPICQGEYELQEPLAMSKLGPYTIPLKPKVDNKMEGRGGFYIHGDTTPSGNASHGCIIMPRNIREQMWKSGDHCLIVER